MRSVLLALVVLQEAVTGLGTTVSPLAGHFFAHFAATPFLLTLTNMLLTVLLHTHTSSAGIGMGMSMEKDTVPRQRARQPS